MSELRKIIPLAPFPEMTGVPDLGVRPELRWVPPTSLLVDETYQRKLTRRSYRLIRGLCASFAWRKMKPPIVVAVADGFHCVDGQHTAIAAATLGIKQIPVFVVEAASIEERADAFVAHNSDRIVMSIFDVYRARLAAGDTDTLDVQAVCKRAGVRIRSLQPGSKILVGDTSAVGTIQRLVKRRGVIKSRMILEAFVKAQRGPIGPAEIDAAEALMCVARPATTPDAMARVVAALGDRGVLEARMRAASDHRPQKHILLEVYVALLDKQTLRPAARTA